MRRSGVFLIVGLLAGGLLLVGTSEAGRVVAIHGEGFLEISDSGQTVIHTKGTPYEMGYQYGALIGDQIAGIQKTIYTAAAKYLREEVPDLDLDIPPALIDFVELLGGALFRPYFRDFEIEHFQGMIDAMDRYHPGHNMNVTKLIFLNSLVDAGGLLGGSRINCDSFAAWGSLTEGGKVFQTRNVDLFIGWGLEDFAVVEVAKQTNKIPLCNPAWAGHLGMASGMNARGLAIGQIWGFSSEKGIGRPWPMNLRQALQETWSSEAAAYWLRDEPHRTYGSNFIFADPTSGFGVAVETTAQSWAMFYSMDPRERLLKYNGEILAIQIPDAVFRADTAFDLHIRSVQTAAKGPDGDPRTSGSYRNRYKGQADIIAAFRDRGILIGMDEAEHVSRETAMPDASLQCVVYGNSDLLMRVADAGKDAQGQPIGAYALPYRQYNFDRVAPVMNLELNREQFRTNSVLNLAVSTKNYGSAKKMNLIVVLEAGGQFYYLPSFSTVPQTMALNLAVGEERRDNLLTVRLGREMPPGEYTFYAALFDGTSGDLADLSIRKWSFSRY
jgi:hypothetical protein